MDIQDVKTERDNLIDVTRAAVTLARLIDGVQWDDALDDDDLLTERVMGSRVFAQLADLPQAQAALTDFARAALRVYSAFPFSERTLPTRTCQHCGQEFTPRRYYHMHCSYECAQADKTANGQA